MKIMSTRHTRNLLVWLHVVTSVAWMSQALALLALLVTGLSASDAGTRGSAYTMATVLDKQVLLHMANASIFSGLMLSALTPWGYFQYWWVLTKFVITMTQLYLGIFVLSPRLDALAQAAVQGHAGSPGFLIAGSLLMASAIAFQAWLSVAKPWKRTPWAEVAGKPKKLPSGPSWMFLFATGVPVFDYLFGTFVLGFHLPLLTLATALGYPFWRARQLQSSVG
jgi:hypothetical protein